jgi:hypothetical protein
MLYPDNAMLYGKALVAFEAVVAFFPFFVIRLSGGANDEKSRFV